MAVTVLIVMAKVTTVVTVVCSNTAQVASVVVVIDLSGYDRATKR